MSKHQAFWNKEYKTAEHLALSDEPSEDLEKFIRFLERQEGRRSLNVTCRALDLGCGNGRNLILLGRYGMRGTGYDISDEAVKLARKNSGDLPLEYEARSIVGKFDKIPDASQTIVLDMMTSHFLNKAERAQLKAEVLRVLKPGGWYFFKTFLADDDQHVTRLLRDAPGAEEGTYIHPRMGVPEFVYSEAGIYEFFEPDFIIQKVDRSHKHIKDGHAYKRRTITVYLQKAY
ncbi:MAG TPA: class I SAM-dependent methyltransferase [Candidatus Paceibacterota bacterium]|nr:class I SAM-dependent methyltransferase [Candidatus Paceibacterota bacterium]